MSIMGNCRSVCVQDKVRETSIVINSHSTMTSFQVSHQRDPLNVFVPDSDSVPSLCSLLREEPSFSQSDSSSSQNQETETFEKKEFILHFNDIEYRVPELLPIEKSSIFMSRNQNPFLSSKKIFGIKQNRCLSFEDLSKQTNKDSKKRADQVTADKISSINMTEDQS